MSSSSVYHFTCTRTAHELNPGAGISRVSRSTALLRPPIQPDAGILCNLMRSFKRDTECLFSAELAWH